MITIRQALADMALTAFVVGLLMYVGGRAHQAWIDDRDCPHGEPSAWERPLVVMLNGARRRDASDPFDWEQDPDLKGDW